MYSRILSSFFLALFIPASQAQQMRETFITSMEWNGDYWLIGGFHSSREKGVSQFLVQYNGESFFDLSEKLKLRTPELTLEDLGWNGEYWLITAGGYLTKYDGETFLDTNMRNEGMCYSMPGLGWNGEYWLIGCTEGGHYRYNGTDFTRIGYTGPVSDIEWNGEHWLLGGDSKVGMMAQPIISKFDGKNLTELASKVRKAKWNGEYWFLFDWKLMKYEKDILTDLTLDAGLTGAGAAGWSSADEYWLIGGEYWLSEGGYRLIKYDGEGFTDLSSQFNNRIVIKEPVLLPSKSTTPEPQRGVCGPTTLMFLSILPALAWRAIRN